MRHKALISVAAAMLAAGCQTTTAPAELSVASVEKALSDRTAIIGEGGGRWQVEYTAADGRLFIWNPGATVTLGGRWRVRSQAMRDLRGHFDEVQVCYTYAHTPSVEGGLTLGEEKCADAAYPLGLKGHRRIETRRGDLFGLTAGVTPTGTATPPPPWPR